MCGILGSVGIQVDDQSRLAFRRALDKMIHRGPDAYGVWEESGCHVYLGHRRLSIIDLSEQGNQPMESASGRFQIVFNGEIYNYKELRSALSSEGVPFTTQTDTEVILALYEKYGAAMLQHLDGMFAIAIWDNEAQELFLARDRFGEKPLYYQLQQGRLIFGSEIKAVVNFGHSDGVNESRLAAYLIFKSVSQPNAPDSTYYHGIKEFPPATYGIFKEGKLVTNTYYVPAVQQHTTFAETLEQDIEKFRQLFFTSIERRLRADVKVGSSLSGGLDSSSILCAVHDMLQGKQAQYAFSARFKDFSKDEGKYIHQVLEGKQVSGYETFPDAEDLSSHIEKFQFHQEEVCGSASVFAQWKVMELANQTGVTVLLDGQGADEYLAGYHSFYPDYFRELRKTDTKLYKGALRAYKALFGVPFKFPVYDKVINLSPVLYEKVRDQYFSRIRPKHLHLEFFDAHKHVPNPNIKKGGAFKERLKYRLTGSGLNNLLRYSDRNSMAFSREVRLPFLSHELVDFSLALPMDRQINNAWTKFILRKAMEAYLPKAIVWRKDKIGYEPPQNRWLSHKKLKALAGDSKQFLMNRGVYDPKYGETAPDWVSIQCYFLYKNLESFKS